MGLYGLWEGYFVGGERKKGVCESIGYIEGKCPEGLLPAVVRHLSQAWGLPYLIGKERDPVYHTFVNMLPSGLTLLSKLMILSGKVKH